MSEELVLTPPDRESIGQQLKRLREAKGLSIAAAAAKLHCDQSILVALEADRFEELGAPVFAQGHLRRYAEFVSAPVAELLAEWSQRSARAGAPDLTRIARAPVPAVDRQAWGRRLAGLAGAIVIAVSAWWILKGGSVQSAPSPAPAANIASMSLPAPKAAAPAVPAVVESTPSVATAAATMAAVASEAVPTETAPAVVVPTAAVPAVAASSDTGRIVLAVRVRENCWTEIYDATGRRLYFGNLRVGDGARVSGVPPLRVLLGRADSATLEIDGRTVAIPDSLMRNAIARFSVDASARLQGLPPASATTP